MRPKGSTFGEPRVKDLKEELRRTGYRLIIAIHPEKPDTSKGENKSRDLFVINADGTGLKRLFKTPYKDEHHPRTSPNGKYFTYSKGEHLVYTKTLKHRSKQYEYGYVWTPDSKQTVYSDNKGIYYLDLKTGKEVKTYPINQKNLEILDMSPDSKWFVFALRNYKGKKYTIDYISSRGGGIKRMPNHPIRSWGPKGKILPIGECHPAFSPDGKLMCWNAGGALAIRKFDPSYPGGTDNKIITLQREMMGQDPCGRWSHCGRYIAYVRIPHKGTEFVHSPLHIVRVSDRAMIRLSPPGWVGHHWDYDWIPPEED